MAAYRITLSASGATPATSYIWYDGVGKRFCSDQALTTPIDRVTMPTRTGWTVEGFFAGTSSTAVQYIAQDGSFTDALLALSITGAKTFYAHQHANQYTLSFDYGEGTGDVAQKTVTYGKKVGELPAASNPDAALVGWFVDGVELKSTTVWKTEGDATAVAVWDPHFGRVVDWFGLASDWLVPVSSDSGDALKRVAPSNGGKFASGVNETGGVWRSPSVTYRVVKHGRLSVTLGKAFAAQKSGGRMTVSGYMIVSASIRTAIGEFPTVTVRGAANEGADAINKFVFAADVKSWSDAQNLLGALSATANGGLLQEMEVVASCSPVVLEENLMPCASDVVEGVIDATAVTVASQDDAAPAAANGFAVVAQPQAHGCDALKTWRVAMRKEMV